MSFCCPFGGFWADRVQNDPLPERSLSQTQPRAAELVTKSSPSTPAFSVPPVSVPKNDAPPKFLPSRLWSLLVDAVCRPPRDIYSTDDLIGREEGYFYLGGKKYIRIDVTLKNRLGLNLQCSLYRAPPPADKGTTPEPEAPRPSFPPSNPSPSTSTTRTPTISRRSPLPTQTPCVVYCHCNSGSRRDAEEALLTLLPVGIAVFALDFSGSGLSGGHFVTLGHHEQHDIATAVQYLRGRGDIGRIGLWGRSMGAASALLYAAQDPTIACMVLDSPFANLMRLVKEISRGLGTYIPRPVAAIAIRMLRRSVQKRAGFDMTTVQPERVAPLSFIPALFCHAKGDDFIRPDHSKSLYEMYKGDKNYITFEGDHNSCRPHFFYTSVTIFMHSALGAQELMISPNVGPLVLREPSRRVRHHSRKHATSGVNASMTSNGSSTHHGSSMMNGPSQHGTHASHLVERSSRGAIRVEPLPLWLEHRVQRKVAKMEEEDDGMQGAARSTEGSSMRGPSSSEMVKSYAKSESIKMRPGDKNQVGGNQVGSMAGAPTALPPLPPPASTPDRAPRVSGSTVSPWPPAVPPTRTSSGKKTTLPIKHSPTSSSTSSDELPVKSAMSAAVLPRLDPLVKTTSGSTLTSTSASTSIDVALVSSSSLALALPPASAAS